MRHFTNADTALFFSKGDPNDPRLGDFAQVPRDFVADHWHIAGYPDDEGVSLSGGRVGAANAPDNVRTLLYKMTPALSATGTPRPLYDVGNLNIEGTLGERHTRVRHSVREALAADARWVGIGGGHDYGFADGSGFLDWCKITGQRGLVVNIDAHLDVRPVAHGLSSGTPFFRLLEEFGSNFDFADVGIQSQCNSRTHLRWARERGARVITWDEIALSGESPVIVVSRTLQDWLAKKRPVFLSIDLDAFASPYGAGTSQNFPFGFTPNDFLPLLEVMRTRWDVRILGLYETSPRLDSSGLTAALAATLAHRLVAQD